MDGGIGLSNTPPFVWNLTLLCLMWTVRRERNQCSFEDVELSFVHLKSSFIIKLFKWSCVSSHREIHSIIDSIHSLSF